MTTICIGRANDQGLRPNDEDRIITKSFAIDDSTRSFTLVAVFDGHGGQETVEYLVKHFATELEVQLNISDTIRDAITATFENIDSRLENYGSGSTCVLALMEEGTSDMWCAHIGDSRMIIKQKENVIATIDHKPSLEKENIRIRCAGGYVFQHRLNGIIAVSRAFGDFGSDLKPDMLIAIPDISHHTMSEGDVAILVSDGVTDVISTEDITELGVSSDDADTVATAIKDSALKKGTRDNVSVIVVQWK